jgi:microcystin-dependent protein
MSNGIKISQLINGGSTTLFDFLPIERGVETLKIPTSQFVVDGANITTGTPQATIFIGKQESNGSILQFRSLSGVDGISVANIGNTIVVTGSGQNPVKTSIIGNNINTTYPINGAQSINANNYRVDIDGILQEPLTDYNIVDSNIVFTSAPPLSGKVTVVSNNLVRAYDVVPSDGSVTTNKIALSSVTTSKLATDVQYSLVPTGAIMPFYRTTAPSGWLVCDGAAIPPRYSALIDLVGANTPNLRGMFIRGWSSDTSTTSRDPLSGSRTLGSVQNDAFESHTHPYTWTTGEVPAGTYAVGGSGLTRTTNNGITSPTGDLETRPVNIALLYCIKT